MGTFPCVLSCTLFCQTSLNVINIAEPKHMIIMPSFKTLTSQSQNGLNTLKFSACAWAGVPKFFCTQAFLIFLVMTIPWSALRWCSCTPVIEVTPCLALCFWLLFFRPRAILWLLPRGLRYSYVMGLHFGTEKTEKSQRGISCSLLGERPCHETSVIGLCTGHL